MLLVHQARRHAERGAFLEIASQDHVTALAHYTQAAVHLENALEVILRRIRNYAAKLRTLRPQVDSPEAWENISLPSGNLRTVDKRYVCEIEGVVVTGRHCGRCVDVGFPGVLRQLFQLMQIPSLGGDAGLPSLRAKPDSWKTVLLSGPAATGRHSLARALSAGIRVCSVSYVCVPEFLRRPKQQLAAATRAVFDASRAVVPTVVILDRVDELCNSTGDALDVFCECIREVLDWDGVPCRYVIGVTNSPWLLSSSLQTLFQRRVYVPLPDRTCRAHITQHLLSGSDGYAASLSLADIADATEGFTSTELTMCLRSPFWQADKRKRLDERFVELNGLSGLMQASCCYSTEDVDEELTPLSQIDDEVEDPRAPRSSPKLPVDAELKKAIGDMCKVLAKNARLRSPPQPAGMRAISRSSLRNCNIS
ncbi:vacuolar protein sorting-associated protein 4B-like [Haemaphysalis longicornis]